MIIAVYGAYTARSGGGAALRAWCGLGGPRARWSEAALQSRARREQARRDGWERRIFLQRMETEYGVEGDDAAMEAARRENQLPYSEVGHSTTFADEFTFLLNALY